MGRFAQYKKRGTGPSPDQYPAPVFGEDCGAVQEDARIAVSCGAIPAGADPVRVGIGFNAWNAANPDAIMSGVVVCDEGGDNFIDLPFEPDPGDTIKVVARFIDLESNVPLSPQSAAQTIVWT